MAAVHLHKEAQQQWLAPDKSLVKTHSRDLDSSVALAATPVMGAGTGHGGGGGGSGGGAPGGHQQMLPTLLDPIPQREQESRPGPPAHPSVPSEDQSGLQHQCSENIKEGAARASMQADLDHITSRAGSKLMAVRENETLFEEVPGGAEVLDALTNTKPASEDCSIWTEAGLAAAPFGPADGGHHQRKKVRLSFHPFRVSQINLPEETYRVFCKLRLHREVSEEEWLHMQKELGHSSTSGGGFLAARRREKCPFEMPKFLYKNCHNLQEVDTEWTAWKRTITEVIEEEEEFLESSPRPSESQSLSKVLSRHSGGEQNPELHTTSRSAGGALAVLPARRLQVEVAEQLNSAGSFRRPTVTARQTKIMNPIASSPAAAPGSTDAPPVLGGDEAAGALPLQVQEHSGKMLGTEQLHQDHPFSSAQAPTAGEGSATKNIGKSSKQKDHKPAAAQTSTRVIYEAISQKIFHGTMQSNMDARQFPFDVQDLSIDLYCEDSDTWEFDEIPEEELDRSFEWAFRMPDWFLCPDSFDVSVERLPVGVLHRCQWRIAREWVPFVWNYFFLLVLTSLFGFFSFAWVEERLGAIDNPRDGLAVVVMVILTNVSFKSSAGESVGNIGYLTYLDIFILATLLVNFLQGGLHALFGVQGPQGDFLILRDWLIRFLFGVYVLFILIFCGWVYRQRDRAKNCHVVEDRSFADDLEEDEGEFENVNITSLESDLAAHMKAAEDAAVSHRASSHGDSSRTPAWMKTLSSDLQQRRDKSFFFADPASWFQKQLAKVALLPFFTAPRQALVVLSRTTKRISGNKRSLELQEGTSDDSDELRDDIAPLTMAQSRSTAVVASTNKSAGSTGLNFQVRRTLVANPGGGRATTEAGGQHCGTSRRTSVRVGASSSLTSAARSGSGHHNLFRDGGAAGGAGRSKRGVTFFNPMVPGDQMTGDPHFAARFNTGTDNRFTTTSAWDHGRSTEVGRVDKLRETTASMLHASVDSRADYDRERQKTIVGILDALEEGENSQDTLDRLWCALRSENSVALSRGSL
ncbi:unnamed protein product [Amoebophrya sp. A120]|nr:unnamed protein product [Amoebophrya sp. A120]|eukprot:GSA120T00011276001.1